MTGGERLFIDEAFASQWLSTVGPHLRCLENEFEAVVGVPAVALSSGTAGLHLAVRLAGVSHGDEVVASTLTFVASCNPILYQDATPVFVDCERRSWNLDPELLSDFLGRRARVNRLPKAVVVVHLYGESANLSAIADTCARYGLPLVEDCAHALGTRYAGRQVGSFGDVGVFSLGGNKMVTATAGGILASRRSGWVEKARFWSTQARDPDPDRLNNYIHSEVGHNYRMSNVLAGIARGQLEALELRVEQRRKVFERYRTAFSEIPGLVAQPENSCGTTEPPRAVSGQPQLPRATVFSRHARWLSSFLVDETEFGISSAQLIWFLDAANVEARPVWKPMHTQPLYRNYECVGGEVAEDLNRRGICLPSSSCLSADDQQFVIDRVIEAHEKAKGRGR